MSSDFEEKFHKLRIQWESETKILSSTTAITNNSNYRQIVEMGKEVIPLLLEDISNNGSFWDSALIELSGENPVDQSDWGKMSKMREVWLKWGKEKGYLK
jgi:hypothetical protein